MRPAILAIALLLAACESQAEPAASPSPVVSPQASPQPSPEPSPAETAAECSDESVTGQAEATIELTDNSFSPGCLVVVGGQSLVFENRGTNLHNFSVQGAQVDIDTRPGETTRTEAIGTIVESGTHVFFCKYHRSQGMEGEITISEAG